MQERDDENQDLDGDGSVDGAAWHGVCGGGGAVKEGGAADAVSFKRSSRGVDLNQIITQASPPTQGGGGIAAVFKAMAGKTVWMKFSYAGNCHKSPQEMFASCSKVYDLLALTGNADGTKICPELSDSRDGAIYFQCATVEDNRKLWSITVARPDSRGGLFNQSILWSVQPGLIESDAASYTVYGEESYSPGAINNMFMSAGGVGSYDFGRTDGGAVNSSKNILYLDQIERGIMKSSYMTYN